MQNIHGKTFAVGPKVCENRESFPLKCFAVYGIIIIAICVVMYKASYGYKSVSTLLLSVMTFHVIIDGCHDELEHYCIVIHVYT